jgi:AraC family transcriptional regulator
MSPSDGDSTTARHDRNAPGASGTCFAPPSSASILGVAETSIRRLEVLSMLTVTVEHVRPRRVIAMMHRGDYSLIGDAFTQLRTYAASRGLPTDASRFAGIYYDDPATTAADQLRSAACLEVGDDFQPADGDPVSILTIAGGRHAIAVHRGPYANLGASYRWLFREWLPSSGFAPALRACFEVYLNDAQATPKEKLETAIHVPLAERTTGAAQ